MGKNKLTKDGLLFCGMNSEDVTGSCIYGVFDDKKFLLECGLHQSSSNNYLDSYKANSSKFRFNPKEIDYVFIGHAHIDHCGLLPRLIKEGFSGQVICTEETKQIMIPLLLNCSFILDHEAKILSKKYKREYKNIYEEQNVYELIDKIVTYNEFNKVYKLDDKISFQFLQNSHCIGAVQIQLILNNGIKRKKILYSSDIGSLNKKNHYVDKTIIPDTYNDYVIMESTYGDTTKFYNRTREKDLAHLKVAIDTTLDRKGTVIFPAFSFSKTQELVSVLYELYHESSFDYNIYIDSKLSCDISELYSKILVDENLEKWNKVISWKNVNFIKDKEISRECISNRKPKIIISSSGFCTNGRVVSYLEKYLSDSNSMIIFTGYVGDNPSYLSYRIKNYKENKLIKINKIPVKNNADTISLYTFSSHANYKELIEYGSNLNTEKVILVHGSEKAKKNLKEKLQEKISKNDKTYKVVCSSKDMILYL